MAVSSNKYKIWQLIKNPKSLEHFGKKCRGVILLNGDLYIESFSNATIHNDLLKELYIQNIFSESPAKNWSKKLPEESGFLTVQRFNDTDIIAIGESNALIYDVDNWKKLINIYEQVLSKAAFKNPNIIFTNKLIGIKSFASKHNVNAENIITI